MVRDSIRKSSCFLNYRLLLQTISCGISESPLHFFFLCNCAGMKHHKTLLHVYEARRPRQRTYFPPSLRCMVWMEWREKCSWNRAERWQPPITDQLTAGNRQSQLNFYSSTRNIHTYTPGRLFQCISSVREQGSYFGKSMSVEFRENSWRKIDFRTFNNNHESGFWIWLKD